MAHKRKKGDRLIVLLFSVTLLFTAFMLEAAIGIEPMNKGFAAGGRGGKDPDKPAVKFNNAHYGTLRRSKIDSSNRSGTEGVCTLYSFRHTFATRFLERRPGDLLTLAALLGHSNLRMVMRYAHPSDEHKFEAISSMDDLESLEEMPTGKSQLN